MKNTGNHYILLTKSEYTDKDNANLLDVNKMKEYFPLGIFKDRKRVAF